MCRATRFAGLLARVAVAVSDCVDVRACVPAQLLFCPDSPRDLAHWELVRLNDHAHLHLLSLDDSSSSSAAAAAAASHGAGAGAAGAGAAGHAKKTDGAAAEEEKKQEGTGEQAKKGT